VFFERGEKIELLVDKTDALSQQSFKFVHSVSDKSKGEWKGDFYSMLGIEHIYLTNFICY